MPEQTNQRADLNHRISHFQGLNDQAPSPPPRDYSRRFPANWADAIRPNFRPQPVQLQLRSSRDRQIEPPRRQQPRNIDRNSEIEATLFEIRDQLSQIILTTQQIQRLVRIVHTNFPFSANNLPRRAISPNASD
jgi:hypothetical protein